MIQSPKVLSKNTLILAKSQAAWSLTLTSPSSKTVFNFIINYLKNDSFFYFSFSFKKSKNFSNNFKILIL